MITLRDYERDSMVRCAAQTLAFNKSPKQLSRMHDAAFSRWLSAKTVPDRESAAIALDSIMAAQDLQEVRKQWKDLIQ